MQPFTYIKVQEKQAAIDAAKTDNMSKFIGGGTNLVDLMKMGVENPRRLININDIGSLQKIEVRHDGSVLIGALVRNSDLAYHPHIKDHFPLLSEALLAGASPQLRNMATTAGNLMQRTRCPYFFDTSFACNKRNPGSGCSAINGYNRSHAVLGTSENCIATHPSDMCVAMAALNASIHVLGPSGERKIPFTEFHLIPGNTPGKETVLGPGELITAVEIPALTFGKRSKYLKVRDRSSYEFALASAAVALEISGGSVRNARIALGGIATKPWRSFNAEEKLKGLPANEQSFRAAADVALAEAKAYQFNAFKIELAKRTLIRSLSQAGGMS